MAESIASFSESARRENSRYSTPYCRLRVASSQPASNSPSATSEVMSSRSAQDQSEIEFLWVHWSHSSPYSSALVRWQHASTRPRMWRAWFSGTRGVEYTTTLQPSRLANGHHSLPQACALPPGSTCLRISDSSLDVLVRVTRSCHRQNPRQLLTTVKQRSSVSTRLGAPIVECTGFHGE